MAKVGMMLIGCMTLLMLFIWGTSDQETRRLIVMGSIMFVVIIMTAFAMLVAGRQGSNRQRARDDEFMDYPRQLQNQRGPMIVMGPQGGMHGSPYPQLPMHAPQLPMDDPYSDYDDGEYTFVDDDGGIPSGRDW